MVLTEGRGLGLFDGEETRPTGEARSETARMETPGTEASRLGVDRVRAEVAALVPVYSAVLFRVAHAVLRNRAESDDVVQETFLRVLLHGDELHRLRDRRVWLIRIAWRLALDRRRRIRPEQMDRSFAEALVDRDLPADAAMTQAQEYARVLQAMDRLPKAERAVLLLAAAEEMTMAEMAGVVGRSESAVRALLFRARARLRERLREGGR